MAVEVSLDGRSYRADTMTKQEKWQNDMEKELEDSARDGVLYTVAVSLAVVLTLLMLWL